MKRGQHSSFRVPTLEESAQGAEADGKGARRGRKRQAKEPREHALPKIVLPALAVSVALVCAGGYAFSASLPAQGDTGTGLNYNYVCSGAKSQSIDFSLSGAAPNSILLMDSSQLITAANTVEEVPLNVLGGNSYGFDLNYIGETYTQSLWHAIAAGAYAPRLQNKKVAIITGVTSFEDGGVDNETFGMRFSYGLYRTFCDNPSISQASKDYVAKRLSEQGIDDARIHAGLRDQPQDYLNDAVFAAEDDLKLRNDLEDVRGKGTDLSRKSGERPSFKELRRQGLQDAKADSTNNTWGMDDAFYARNIKGRKGLLKNSSADETYTDTPEYGDFDFFLTVCEESGIEPLVIISPVNGKFFDWIGVSQKTREKCYKHIRKICKQHGAKVADFSGHEYERYFTHDIVHFGWTGWVDVEEALDGFVNGK